MRRSIKERLEALENQLRAGIPPVPYEELDPLSRAMVDFAAELAALDGPGRQAVADEAGMTLEAMEKMIRSIPLRYRY